MNKNKIENLRVVFDYYLRINVNSCIPNQKNITR